MPVAVLIAILIMVIATFAVAMLVLAPRMQAANLVFDDRPDRPPPFGYRMAWLAIRTRDTEGVLEALELHGVATANWNSGLGTIYDKVQGQAHVFVSPPVNGWTFVVGLPLPHPLGRGFADKATPFLAALAERFVEVQYYFTYPVIDYFAWARFIDGRLVRAFALSDEGVIWNVGKATKEEKAMGVQLFEPKPKGKKREASGGVSLVPAPTELHVMQLAGKWSIDPTRIDAVPGEPGLGFIARAPMAWKAERVKKVA